jgi:hypothetical protein
MDDTKSKKQKISSSQEAPAEYQDLMRMMDYLQQKFAATWPDGKGQINDLLRVLQSGCWAFNPKTTPKIRSDIDRFGNVILGPLFSSKEFPWPWDADAPMAPLLQINLEEAGELGNIDLGKGLLQVWLPKDAKPVDRAYCRVVPPEGTKSGLLDSIPSFDPRDKYFQPADWALEERDRSVNDDGYCYQIVDWSRRFTSQLYIENFGDFESSIPEVLIDDELNLTLKRFRATLKRFRKKWSPSDNHLFGTFYPVQYKWDERPQPLFCFDGDAEHGTAWGDGSAQVFFERDTNGCLNFSFEWSCY